MHVHYERLYVRLHGLSQLPLGSASAGRAPRAAAATRPGGVVSPSPFVAEATASELTRIRILFATLKKTG